MDQRGTPILPVPVMPRHINVAKVNAEAEMLSKLAHSIPGQVQQAEQGVVSKDLGKNLKHIEKLSKELHRDLYL